ncbi:MAG: type II secretion system protein [Patescibacteria group bacterium]|jgi:type II secretory pathway pseudopilin PulG|nr:type II secretion system protein [Patescibacteria group bacterium]
MIKKKQGITLIELMVAFLIITMIATVGIISIKNTRAKSRDAKRAYDIQQYAKALRLYAQDHGNNFPAANGYLGRGSELDEMLRPYFRDLPKDPLDTGGDSMLDYYYYYVASNVCLGVNYPTVHAQNMETDKSELNDNTCTDGLGGSDNGYADQADFLAIIFY